MAGLNRGMTRRYADGTDDVAPKFVKTVPVDPYGSRSVTTVPVTVPPDQQVPDVSSFSKAPVLPANSFTPLPAVTSPPVVTPPPAPQSFRQILGDAIGMRGPEARAAAFSGGPPSAQPSGMGQFLRGDFPAAAANPESSPFTTWLANINQQADMSNRASRLGVGPSVFEQIGDFFAGNKASRAAIDQRIATANAFNNPQVKQHLSTHLDDLRQFEAAIAQDPAAAMRAVQSPDFLQHMNDVKTHLTNLTTNGAVHNDGNGPPIVVPPDQIKDAAAAAKIKTTVPGSTDAHAVAATQPQDFSADQFARIFQGMPKRDFATIFGPVLAHISSPQEQIQRAYFGGLQTEYAKRVAERQKLLSADPNADVRAQDAAIAEQLALIRKEAKAFGEITTRRPSFPTE